jgi:hypothetical protein
LRDFIIALDKTKADKLRYKVEDSVVKIFITPYRTSLSDKDLEFSQGEFNVDVVLALGVHAQAELDQAITAHGRILHDATVATLNVKPGGELGSLNWLDTNASSLCELALELIIVMDNKAVDAQIATALLTGIVAETDRFRNERTKPNTMSISAELMAAGANQQLVMTKLEEPEPAPPPPPEHEIRLGPSDKPETKSDEKPAAPAPADTPASDGTLEITHAPEPVPEPELPVQSDETKEHSGEEEKPLASLEDLAGTNSEKEAEKEEDTPKIRIDDQGRLHSEKEALAEEKKATSSIDPTQHIGGSRMVLQPPSMGGAMSATGTPVDGFSDPLSASQPEESPSGSPFSPVASANITAPPAPFMPASMTPGPPPAPSPTMSSPLFGAGPPQPSPFGPVDQAPVSEGTPPDLASSAPSFATPPAHVDNARDAVNQALAFDSHAGGNHLPDMGTPQLANNGIPAPTGTPPPVPPPMLPPASQ